MKNNFTHYELCVEASSYLRNKGIVPFNKCQYVVCELARVGECPDAFGFNSVSTQLIEVKVSRADFLADKNKYWRKNPDMGLGNHRSYLCPEGIIQKEDLPKDWGLLWINERGIITEIVRPFWQKSSKEQEVRLMTSILRREGIRPQIFNYNKNK